MGRKYTAIPGGLYPYDIFVSITTSKIGCHSLVQVQSNGPAEKCIKDPMCFMHMVQTEMM